MSCVRPVAAQVPGVITMVLAPRPMHPLAHTCAPLCCNTPDEARALCVAAQVPGVIVMVLASGKQDGPAYDPANEAIVVAFNAAPTVQVGCAGAVGGGLGVCAEGPGLGVRGSGARGFEVCGRVRGFGWMGSIRAGASRCCTDELAVRRLTHACVPPTLRALTPSHTRHAHAVSHAGCVIPASRAAPGAAPGAGRSCPGGPLAAHVRGVG